MTPPKRPRGTALRLLLTGAIALSLAAFPDSGQAAPALRVGHLVHSPSSEITGARLSYSLDGGVGWTPAVVVPTKDGYRAIVPPRALSPGSSLSLRATATDAAGSSITQTVIAAIPVY